MVSVGGVEEALCWGDGEEGRDREGKMEMDNGAGLAALAGCLVSARPLVLLSPVLSVAGLWERWVSAPHCLDSAVVGLSVAPS